MLYKLLSELSTRELRTAFRRAGKTGIFVESEAIVKMTIFIVNIGQDPFTYRFRISDAEVEKNASVVNVQVEDMNLDSDSVEHNVPENLLDSGCEEVTEVSTSGMTEDVSVVSEINATVVKVVEDMNLDLDKVEDNVPGCMLDSECEEVSENTTSRMTDDNYVVLENVPVSVCSSLTLEEPASTADNSLSVRSSPGSVFKFKVEGLFISSTMTFVRSSTMLSVAQPSSWQSRASLLSPGKSLKCQASSRRSSVICIKLTVKPKEENSKKWPPDFWT